MNMPAQALLWMDRDYDEHKLLLQGIQCDQSSLRYTELEVVSSDALGKLRRSADELMRLRADVVSCWLLCWLLSFDGANDLEPTVMEPE